MIHLLTTGSHSDFAIHAAFADVPGRDFKADCAALQAAYDEAAGPFPPYPADNHSRGFAARACGS